MINETQKMAYRKMENEMQTFEIWKMKCRKMKTDLGKMKNEK